MSRSIVRLAARQRGEFRRPRVRLSVEALEDRLVLNGSGLLLPGEIDYTVHTAVIPNDTSFGSLWGMHNTGQSGGTIDADIDAPEAWDLHTGSYRTSVGVIDTGIDYRHPDLYLNIWINQDEIPTAIRNNLTDIDGDGLITFWDLNNSVNQGSGKIQDWNGNGYIDGGDLLDNRSGWKDGIDADPYVVNGVTYSRVDDLIGWDFFNNDNDPFDDNDHGTHVAGTIGAIGNNSRGVTGVNWKVSMAGLKFLGSNGSGPISAALAALDYAVANGIKITNNSWGGGGFSTSFSNALTRAQNAGHIFVAAAGNAGSNNDTTANYPSNYPQANVVAVASTTRTDGLSSFSNYGATQVDLGAPGSSILSTTPNNTYSTFSGTSMATPHVAGAIALIWDRNPSWTYDQVISTVLQNTDPVAALAGKTVTGGRLNLFKALSTAPGDTGGPRVTLASWSGPSSSSVDKVTVTFTESINPTTFTPSDVVLTGPGGAVTVSAVQAVAGTDNTRFEITFAAQTAPGTYTMTLGPDIRDTSGNPMDQNNNGINGEAGDTYTTSTSITSSSTTTFTSANVPLNIRDFTTTISTLFVGTSMTITDVNVTFNITHTYVGDLRIYLVSPTGRLITLVSNRGGSGDNFTNTTLDDQAAVSILSASAPFAGTFRPQTALSAYNGLNAQGTWQLRVYDSASLDIGTLNSWSLTITGTVGGSSITKPGKGGGRGNEKAPHRVEKGLVRGDDFDRSRSENRSRRRKA